MTFNKLSLFMFILASPLFLQTDATQAPEATPQAPAKKDDQQQKIPDPLVLEGGTTVAASQFVIQGNQAVATDQLERLVAPYLNRSLSRSDLFEIRNRIQLTYQVKGFDKPEVIISGTPRGTTLTITIVEKKQPSGKWQ